MKTNAKKEPLAELLLAKYRSDPKRFRAYLPEVAQTLDLSYPPYKPGRNPFGLTEHERTHRLEELGSILRLLNQRSINREQSIEGLEHCAALIADNSLPSDVEYKTIVGFLRPVIGKAPASLKVASKIPIREVGGGQTVQHISLLRGVVLDLSWDMRLVSVTISPRQVQERRKALRLVGIASDSHSDVAERHDYYLAERDPHAAP